MVVQCNELTEHIFLLKEKGLFSDYSNDHMLLRALNGHFDLFEKYPGIGKDSVGVYDGASCPDTFISNLSTALLLLENHFGEEKIHTFVRNQLAAGKGNYNESRFLDSLFEISVLRYICSRDRIERALYEPKVLDSKNPEATVKYKNGITLNVEVKNSGNRAQIVIQNLYNGYIRPHFIMTDSERSEFRAMCKLKKLQFDTPRILMLKDFIKSAASKFTKVDNKFEFNVLYINWSYVDNSSWLDEPTTLLANPVNGILYSKKAQNILGIGDDIMNKISAIVLLKESFESILFTANIWGQAAGHRTKLLILDHVPEEGKNNLSSFINLREHDRREVSGYLSFDFSPGNKDIFSICVDIYHKSQMHWVFGITT